MFPGNSYLPVVGGGGTGTGCCRGGTCCTAGMTMPGPMSMTNSITVYKIQISERLSSHTLCTGMTVPMSSFCMRHESSISGRYNEWYQRTVSKSLKLPSWQQ